MRQLIEGLQKDTAILFGKLIILLYLPLIRLTYTYCNNLTGKYTVGSQLDGQQGFTNKETGKFELWDSATDKRAQGPNDDTSGLVRSWNGALGRRGTKRRAVEQMDQGVVQINRGYMEGDELDYGET